MWCSPSLLYQVWCFPLSRGHDSLIRFLFYAHALRCVYLIEDKEDFSETTVAVCLNISPNFLGFKACYYDIFRFLYCSQCGTSLWLFYTCVLGYEDRVQCYHCGTEMSITSHDDPTEKHARLSRDCELLRHEIQTLNEDVDRIRNQLQCKVCLNAQVMMTFRPCGHLATCQACADQLSVCPICRSDISDRVKTYF